MEFVGEVVANLFGMNQSKFQWVIDAQRDEERRDAQRRLGARSRARAFPPVLPRNAPLLARAEDSQRRELAETAAAKEATAATTKRAAEGDVEA